MQGAAFDFADGAIQFDVAAFQHHESIAEFKGEIEELLDQNDGHVAPIAQPFDDFADLLDDVGLNALCRFVQQEQFRTRDERPRDGQSQRAGLTGCPAAVHAGEVNLTGPLEVEVTSSGDDTSLRRLADLVAIAETARNRYTSLADRAARIYLKRSANYMVNGVPEDWTGVEALTKK